MFEEILAALSRVLQKRSIPYMVIGGQAVLLYGEPRVTRDIDITLGVGMQVTLMNCSRLPVRFLFELSRGSHEVCSNIRMVLP